MIRADLSERLVEGATWEDRRAIGLAAEMLANEGGDRSLAGWNLAGRRLEAAKRRDGATELFERASESLTAYGKALSDLGVTDAEVAGVAAVVGAAALPAAGALAEAAALPLAAGAAAEPAGVAEPLGAATALAEAEPFGAAAEPAGFADPVGCCASAIAPTPNDNPRTPNV